jgi:hypothetical protein
MSLVSPAARGLQDTGAPQRVYLASRFARQLELRAVARELETDGFEVTSRWLMSPGPLADDDLRDSGPAAEFAQMDFEDLSRAHICVAFTEHPNQARPGRGGRHTELGIALGLGLEVILVGPREHVFHCLPGIEQCTDWPDARQKLAARTLVV